MSKIVNLYDSTLFHSDLPGNEPRYRVISRADSENELRLVLTTVLECLRIRTINFNFGFCTKKSFKYVFCFLFIFLHCVEKD